MDLGYDGYDLHLLVYMIPTRHSMAFLFCDGWHSVRLFCTITFEIDVRKMRYCSMAVLHY